MRILKSHLSKVKNQRGFSLVGVLTASSIGIIVTMGLSKMMFNRNAEVTQIKQTAQQLQLFNLLSSLFASDCKDSLSKSLSNLEELYKGGVGTNKTAIQWKSLKDGSGTEILNTDDQDPANKEKIKRLYNMEGHSRFQLQCAEDDCDCSANENQDPYPRCSKDWLLSLWTMNYKNNLPVYKKMWRQALRISYQSGSSSDFTCNFSKEAPPIENWIGDSCASNHSVTGKGNTFVGFSTGCSITTGAGNSFMGPYNGRSIQTVSKNSFLGPEAGGFSSLYGNNKNNSSLFGFLTGGQHDRGSKITAFGAKSSLNNHGDQNSFFGFEVPRKESGVAITADKLLNMAHVIYGYTSEDDDEDYPSEVGIRIYGSLKQCEGVGDCPLSAQTTASSREYKKNIVSFQDYEEALEALLATPLFNYQFKDDYPEKTRMGVIAEELPISLQLPAEPDSPAQPDWPSIYGHLWAGIKALHKELLAIKELSSKTKLCGLDSNRDKEGDSAQAEKADCITARLEKTLSAGQKRITGPIQILKTEIQELESHFETLQTQSRLLDREFQAQQERLKQLKSEVTELKNKQKVSLKNLKRLKLKEQNNENDTI